MTFLSREYHDFPKTSEDFRRHPKIPEDVLKVSEDVPKISEVLKKLIMPHTDSKPLLITFSVIP